MDTDEETDEAPKVANDTIPEFYVSDLDSRRYEEFYEDGTLKLSVDLKKGLRHGDFEYYYPSGELHIKGAYRDDLPYSTWKYYDETGELTKTDNY
jgi:antitoxin component YwqK of YwqJK toxin-antitoxin module